MKKILIISVLFASFNSWAVDFGENLSPSDLKTMTKFFGATSLYRQTNGPSEMGEIWGVDVGLQASGTRAKDFNAVVNSKGGNSDLIAFPYAYAVFRGGGPYGIGGSFGFIPKVNTSSFSLDAFAFDVRWSWAYFFDFPWTGDIRFHFSKIGFAGNTNISGANAQLSADFMNYGMTASGGWKWRWNWFAIEPYGGLGWLMTSGDFSQSASVPGLFQSSTQENKFDVPSFHFLAGVDFTLAKVIQLVFEYDLIGTTHTIAFQFGVTI